MGALGGEFSRQPDILGEMTSLQYALEAYRENPYDPERVTEAWQAFLPDVEVPECDWTGDRIRKPLTGFRGELYTPLMVPSVASLQGRNGLVHLGQRFPGMENYAVQEGTPIESDILPDGAWVKVEASLDAPNTDTNEKEARDFLKAQGRHGMTVELEILASQFSKRVTGHYLDENTLARQFGSRDEGDVVDAGFDRDGRLGVHRRLAPRYRDPNWGFRSVEVK